MVGAGQDLSARLRQVRFMRGPKFAGSLRGEHSNGPRSFVEERRPCRDSALSQRRRECSVRGGVWDCGRGWSSLLDNQTEVGARSCDGTAAPSETGSVTATGHRWIERHRDSGLCAGLDLVELACRAAGSACGRASRAAAGGVERGGSHGLGCQHSAPLLKQERPTHRPLPAAFLCSGSLGSQACAPFWLASCWHVSRCNSTAQCRFRCVWAGALPGRTRPLWGENKGTSLFCAASLDTMARLPFREGEAGGAQR